MTRRRAWLGTSGVAPKVRPMAEVPSSAARAKLEAYSVAMDLELVCVEMDADAHPYGRGAPELLRALALLAIREVTDLLVAKLLDRLTRSVRDLGDLVERYQSRSAPCSRSPDSIDTRTAGGRSSRTSSRPSASGSVRRRRSAHAKVWLIQSTGVTRRRRALGRRRTTAPIATAGASSSRTKTEMAAIRRAIELRTAGSRSARSPVSSATRAVRPSGWPMAGDNGRRVLAGTAAAA